MATNVPGIAIVIRAFLPTGKTLDEQFAALSLVKDAHASGDYSALLAAANIDDVKTEQKVRRIEEPAAEPAQDNEPLMTQEPAGNFEDGLDEPRENPDDIIVEGIDLPWTADETIALIDGPLDGEIIEPDYEPAPRQRRMAR